MDENFEPLSATPAEEASTQTRSCMLFAAGRGSRLRPLTDHTPKPLLEVGGRALLDLQLDQLAGVGMQKVVTNVSYLGDQIETHLAAREEKSPPEILLSKEPAALETGGGLLAARGLFDEPVIWLLNGDVLFDFPIERFPRRLASEDDLHLLLVPTPAHRETGDFTCEQGRVTGRGATHVYGCLALLRLAAFDAYVARTVKPAADGQAPKFSLQGFLFDRVAAGRVSATVHAGVWFDIGSAEQLSAANAWAAARMDADGTS